MPAEVFHIHVHNAHDQAINRAIEWLKNDGVIVYPTDTIYGLGTSLHSKQAVERVYRIKKIASNKLLSFICSDLKQVSQYAYMSNHAHKIMRRCLPGAFTFVLPATRLVPKIMFRKRRTVGIRIPDSPLCTRIVEKLGHPILSTSVPAGADEFLNDPFQIEQQLGNDVDFILDAGVLVSEPSTIVDLTEDEIRIVREGAGDPALVY